MTMRVAPLFLGVAAIISGGPTAAAVDLRYGAGVELGLAPLLLPTVGAARGSSIGLEYRVANNSFLIASYGYSFYHDQDSSGAATTADDPNPFAYRDATVDVGGRYYSHFSADSAYIEAVMARRRIDVASRTGAGETATRSIDRSLGVGGGIRFLWDDAISLRLGAALDYRIARELQIVGPTEQGHGLALAEKSFEAIELSAVRHRWLLKAAVGVVF